jgi:hypothetical protein
MRTLVAGTHSLPLAGRRPSLTALRLGIALPLILSGAARLAAQWQPLPPADAVARATDQSFSAPDEPVSAADGATNNDESWVHATPEP